MPGKTRTVDVAKLKQQLVAFGKKKGTLTQDELRELLPADLVEPEQLGEWEEMLRDEGVEVAEGANAAGGKKKAARAKARPEPSAADERGRVNDPVRMYLRKMGTISLLTREGEVEFAKRIEAGELAVLEIILGSPIAVPYISELAREIEAGHRRARDVFGSATATDDDGGAVADEATGGYEGAFEHLKACLEQVHALRVEAIAITSDSLEADEQRATLTGKELDLLRDMRLNRLTIDAMVREFAELIDRLDRADRELKQCERRAGMGLVEFERQFRGVRLTEEEEFKLCR
ncbi:MAG: RNA polymerase sigma factor RpoD, partial [Myxococcales bacterium]|nr:RNA polymerase sigma factor RpoD [Myxococcales bacterium]